jgi:hypothetical protein
MEPLALSQTFNGRDLAPLHEGGEGETRLHALAIQEDRAGAALAESTAFLRARQFQVLAQSVEQRSARIERQAMIDSINAQEDVERSGRRIRPLRGT